MYINSLTWCITAACTSLRYFTHCAVCEVVLIGLCVDILREQCVFPQGSSCGDSVPSD